MKERTDLDFEVRWYPFQLNPNAPRESNKLEGYMRKFGTSKEQAMAMARQFGQRFKAVGLPYKFTESDKSGNTFDAHVLHTQLGSMAGLLLRTEWQSASFSLISQKVKLQVIRQCSVMLLPS